jgi:hypothetical protein
MGSQTRPPNDKTHLLLDITFHPSTGTFHIMEALAGDNEADATWEHHTVSNTAPGMLRSLLNRRLWDLERIETHRVNPPLVDSWVIPFLRSEKPQERL